MASKYRNTGQTCVCANNIMVHEDVHDAFVAKLKATVERELKFGDAYNGATQGPIINEGGIVKVMEHIEDAVKRGATLVTGGKRLTGFTRYIEPTILTNVPRDALALNDETFGPCKPIISYSLRLFVSQSTLPCRLVLSAIDVTYSLSH